MEASDPTRLGGVARALLLPWLVIDIAYAVAALVTIGALGGFGGGIAPVPRLEFADTLGRVTGLALTVAFVATGITVLRWFFVTNRNAHALSDWPTVTPGWAVGWFFIPFASLFKPFQAFREVWQASSDPAAPGDVPVPAIMRWWWGGWIVLSLIGNLSFRLAMRAETPDELIFAGWLDVVSVPFDVLAAVTLAMLIARVSAMQRRALKARVGE